MPDEPNFLLINQRPTDVIDPNDDVSLGSGPHSQVWSKSGTPRSDRPDFIWSGLPIMPLFRLNLHDPVRGELLGSARLTRPVQLGTAGRVANESD